MAALLLIGSMLTVILLTRAQLQRQEYAAQRALAAARIADEVLGDLFKRFEYLPVGLEEQRRDGWHWRTRKASRSVELGDTEVIEFEIRNGKTVFIVEVLTRDTSRPNAH